MKRNDKLILEDGTKCTFVRWDNEDDIIVWEAGKNRLLTCHYKTVKSINGQTC